MNSSDQIAQVSPNEATQLAATGALVLDVREPDEWAQGHISDAVHMPLSPDAPSSRVDDR
jgi:rhodanese-related sulfurtransferase